MKGFKHCQFSNRLCDILGWNLCQSLLYQVQINLDAKDYHIVHLNQIEQTHAHSETLTHDLNVTDDIFNRL